MNYIFEPLLQKKHKTIQKDSCISLHNINNDMVECENYVKCKKTEKGWNVYRQSRNSEYLAGTFNNEIYALCVMYFIHARNYESEDRNNAFLMELKKYTEDELDFISNKIAKECETEHFSLNNFKEDSICLEKEDEKYNIFYYGEKNKLYILKRIEFDRAIVVVYNYAILLKSFKQLYKKAISIEPTIKDNYEELFAHFINKKTRD